MPSPEAAARTQIDQHLAAAGWVVQDVNEINLSASRGVAVRELRSRGGPADYILFVDGKALGVVEAKKAGTTLSSVAEQSTRYSHAKKWIPQRWADPLAEQHQIVAEVESRTTTDDQTHYLDAWQSVDSDEGVPLAVAKRVFGADPKPIIEELNQALIA